MTLRMCASRLIAPSLALAISIGSIGCSATHTDDGAPGGSAGTSAQAGAGGLTETNVGAIAVEGVSTWKGNATAAYSIIHDDACDYLTDSLFTIADPELIKRGLHAAFGAIVVSCSVRNVWDQLQAVAAHGHEIVCHSFNHKNFITAVPTPDLSVEIDQATQVLEENLPGHKIQYFIFPEDAFTQSMLDHLATVGYTGARAGIKGVNPPDFADPLHVEFDVYNGENSIYYPQSQDVLKAYVDDAIAKGGWAVRELHGIQDSSWQSIPLADYLAHLDYIKAKQDEGALWVDTPTAVNHYRFARQFCGAPTVLGNALSFSMPSAQCTANATALSVLVTTAVDAPVLSATQNGVPVASKRLGANRFVVDVHPMLGAVTLQGER